MVSDYVKHHLPQRIHFKITEYAHPRGEPHFVNFPLFGVSRLLRRSLGPRDVLFILTGYWGNGYHVKEFNDLRASIAESVRMWVIFHDKPHDNEHQLAANIDVLLLSPFQKRFYGVDTVSADHRDPTVIVPTESYFNREAPFSAAKPMTVGIQGAHDRRDVVSLLELWRHPLFIEQELFNEFAFEWHGTAKPSKAYDELKAFLAERDRPYDIEYEDSPIANDDEFQRILSTLSLFFSLTANNEQSADYHSGSKFTSTFIYSISYNKPVIVYRDLYDLWTDYYGTDDLGFIPYENGQDLAGALMKVAHDYQFYEHLCRSMANFQERLHDDNIRNMQQLLFSIHT